MHRRIWGSISRRPSESLSEALQKRVILLLLTSKQVGTLRKPSLMTIRPRQASPEEWSVFSTYDLRIWSIGILTFLGRGCFASPVDQTTPCALSINLPPIRYTADSPIRAKRSYIYPSSSKLQNQVQPPPQKLPFGLESFSQRRITNEPTSNTMQSCWCGYWRTTPGRALREI